MWCKCWSLHDLWYFLAGAAFWDMLVHIGFQAYGLLPISIWGVTITSSSNYVMIGFAAMLCFVFLYLAHSKRCQGNVADCKCNSADCKCDSSSCH